MSLDLLVYFAAYIEKELGIVYNESNFFQLQNRLDDTCKFFSLSGLQELFNLVQKGLPPNMKQYILDIATNNETLFFRDTKVFQMIQAEVIPSLIKLYPHEKLDFWSLACSSGQEAYSLSMIMNESFASVKFEISASDISNRILNKARLAQYSQLEVQRGLPIALLLKYFKKNNDDVWTLDEKIRKNINFFQANLKQKVMCDKRFHLILCRNVLIYQSLDSRKEIIQRISEHLLPGGFLIMGAGESLLGISDEFEQCFIGGVSVYRARSQSRKAV